MKNLTLQQMKILELKVQSLSNKEIAKVLDSNEKAIKYHITNIYKALEVKNFTQLIIRLDELGVNYVRLDKEDILKQSCKSCANYKPVPFDDYLAKGNGRGTV